MTMRTFLITGASKGIGLALARHWRTRGTLSWASPGTPRVSIPRHIGIGRLG
jgi:NAD(P)-dependent dehydrogenase (short-subunit alcohol dehydrogenase family)